jgi:hypothetical protein
MVASRRLGAAVGSSWAFARPATIRAIAATSPTVAVRPAFVIAHPSSYPEAGSAGENWHQVKSGVKCGNSGFTPRRDGILLKWREGDEAALDRLVPIVHDELRRIARRCMAGERAGHSLQATALVNEAYLRLMRDWKMAKWLMRELRGEG